MHEVNFSEYFVGFLFDTLYLAGIPLLMATLGALAVAIFQALTQIQDQNLSQTVKIVVIVIVFMVAGTSLVQPLVLRTDLVFSDIHRF
ncbi:MAG: flagellar biosynthetic protein FliQ [Roseovarius sp.]|uniref:flagellar biosynthetic protein FliQ n=1 Tax=Roseovarius sp. TaxID=1486281 RepID=UPI001B41D038|nr:flagellar biosynthetic protein FliQ [Roseovarius sp.]MBQ0749819.1 flagellar biosynthetic protein FliQ [Roseovarius sp.]MBQ0811857.1 flagellar biosynthetic protein FliQ [Roseovarius sp.]